MYSGLAFMLAQGYNILTNSSTVEWTGLPAQGMTRSHRYADNPLVGLTTTGLSATFEAGNTDHGLHD